MPSCNAPAALVSRMCRIREPISEKQFAGHVDAADDFLIAATSERMRESSSDRMGFVT